MDDLLRQVRCNLSGKFYVTNDAWLRECVKYYHEEHDNSNVDEVIEFAISQWQLSDLRDISNENPCLPRNLAQEKSTTLRGHFILQMDKVYDISESKYKQLEKIRNISNDNIKATEETTQSWEPKKKRMLYFHLTDGAQDVTAIEYKPIRILNEKLLPGYKLMIKGPVMCRRGVIMLDETNVSEVGGEVETMLVSNAQENILARALNLPENPDPYNDDVKPVVSADVLFDDDFDIDMDAVEQIEKRSQEELTRGLNDQSINLSSNRQSVSTRSVNRYIQPENELIDDHPLNSLTHDTESDLLFDMIDEKEFENFTESSNKPHQIVSNTMSKNIARVFPQQSEFPEDEEMECMEIAPKPQIIEKKIDKNPPRILPQKMDDYPDDNDDLIADEMEFASFDNFQNNKSDETKPIRQISDMSKLKINTNVISPAISSAKRAIVVAPKKQEPVGVKRNASVLSPPVLESPAEKMRCTKNPTKPNKSNNNNNRKITDYLKKDERSEVSPVKPKICDNISDLLNACVTVKGLRKKIRAKLTKYDKLVTNGEYWALNGTITDSTGSIDVAFASEILEQFLGFSVTEMKQKRKLKKENPEIEGQLRKGFRDAEYNLKNLDALLDVELVSGEKPKVIKIINITEKQRDILDKTVKHSTT